MDNRPTVLDSLVERMSTIGSKAQQLEALLNLCYGCGFEHFICLDGRLQDAAIELAADLAGKIGRIADGVEHV